MATIKSRLPHILPNVHTKALPFSDTPSQEIIEKYNFGMRGNLYLFFILVILSQFIHIFFNSKI